MKHMMEEKEMMEEKDMHPYDKKFKRKGMKKEEMMDKMQGGMLK